MLEAYVVNLTKRWDEAKVLAPFTHGLVQCHVEVK